MSAGGGGGGRWVVSFFAESDELVAFFFELQPLVSPVTVRLRLCGLESVKPTEVLAVACGDPSVPWDVHH